MKKTKQEMKEKVDELLFLNENWDGYGATRIGQEVTRNTKNFIDILSDNIINSLSEYDISPNPNGTITFELKPLNNNYLVLEIGEDGISGYSISGNTTMNSLHMELMNNSKPLEKEFTDVINEKFWDLI